MRHRVGDPDGGTSGGGPPAKGIGSMVWGAGRAGRGAREQYQHTDAACAVSVGSRGGVWYDGAVRATRRRGSRTVGCVCDHAAVKASRVRTRDTLVGPWDNGVGVGAVLLQARVQASRFSQEILVRRHVAAQDLVA